jgi:hypothetical protein
MKNNSILPADCLLVPVGSLEFDGIRLHGSGEYRMHKQQILQAIDADKNFFNSGQLQGKTLKTLLSGGFTDKVKKVRYLKNGRAVQADSYSLDDALAVWDYFAFDVTPRGKNQKSAQATKDNAIALIRVLARDSLQDRFEQVYNERRTLEERIEHDKARGEGKVARLTLTDAIKYYKNAHDELSESDKHWLYSNTTDVIYLGVFNKRARQLRQIFNAESVNGLRDRMTADELRYVSEVEDLAARLIMGFDLYPIDAAKEAINRLIIPIQHRAS